MKEYKEFQVPQAIQTKLEEITQKAMDDNFADMSAPTFGQAGLYEWLSSMSQHGSWEPIWQSFNYPFIVMERTVTEKNVEDLTSME